MYSGYLVIEIHSSHPGLVRVFETSTFPRPPSLAYHKNPRVLYGAHFDDLSAGHMHAHTALRRRLLNVDDGLYRVDPITAVAAVDASTLSHYRVYLNPELEADPRLGAAIAEKRSRHRLADRIWRAVGISGLLLLLLRFLLGF